MIIVYGKNCIHECIRSQAKINKVFILDTQAKKDEEFLSLLKDKKISFEIVNKGKMDSLFGNNHQGYGCYRDDYKLYEETVIDMIEGPKKRVLILDGIVDPHNLGAILRSVDAFSFDAVILPKKRSCNITETVAHVSTGAIEHVKIAYVNSLNTIVLRLKERGYWICGTDAKGDVLTSQIDPNLDLAVIIGSEGFGMSKTLVNACDYLITIPMVGHVNSLNASVSCAIVLHDLMK